MFGSNGETSGCFQYFAGGGAAGVRYPIAPSGTVPGGLGGGGDSEASNGLGEDGTANTGGGAGGGGSQAGNPGAALDRDWETT